MTKKITKKMNQEVKKRWVEALRSGEYDQNPTFLKSVSGYCVLGVLCDLVKRDLGLEWLPEDDYNFSIDGCDTSLPQSVSRYTKVNLDGKINEMSFLSCMNDDGTTFLELADIIEKEL